jgi:rSAM/selenodomain-associated transferase 1
MRRVVVIVGKAPLTGHVKTRLCPPLTLATAAGLHAAFLRDTVALARLVEGAEVVILYPPMPGAAAALGDAVGRAVRLLAQRGRGLGEALAGAVTTLLDGGYHQVALISSDNPSLPAVYVVDAFRELARADVVLGPAEDGGYYLIALQAPHLGLFEHITWSTPIVFAQTLERADELGLVVATLPRWYDVDEAASLSRLYAEVMAAHGQVAAHTHAFLRASLPDGLEELVGGSRL